MNTVEWRKHRITGDWFSVEYRITDEDGNVGNWRKVAHVSEEGIADNIVAMCQAGSMPVEAVIQVMVDDRV